MAKIVVLGAGMMGTAITIPLADNGHIVNLVGTHLDNDIIEEIHETRRHPKLRIRVPASVTPYHHLALGEAAEGADLVVIGVSSLGVEWAAEKLNPLLPPHVPVVLLTKGLAGDGGVIRLLTEVFRQGLPAGHRDRVQMAAIGGPSIAGELAVRRQTCVTLAGPDPMLLERIASLLRTSYYHIWTSTDMIGVEACVALKNLYSLAVGIVAGLLEVQGRADNEAMMHNSAAAVFSQGLMETAHLVRYMGGNPDIALSLPGAGDLYVTCQGGRNARMGRYLGLGMTYRQAKAEHMPEETIEGAELALEIGPTLEALIGEGKLSARALPLIRKVVSILCHDAPVTVPWDEFFAAPLDSLGAPA